MSSYVSAEMARLYDTAERHGFALPECTACGHCFYPPQSWCPQCLAPDIHNLVDGGYARVLSTICIHRTLDAAWAAWVPVYVACISTDSNVSLFALADSDLPSGTPVTVHLQKHASGERLFYITARNPV